MTDDGPLDDAAVAGTTAEPPLRPRAPGVLGIVALPGLALWRRAPVVAALLVAAGVIFPFYGAVLLFQHRHDVVGLLGDSASLRFLTMVGIMAVVARLVAVWLTSDRLPDAADRHRLRLVGSAVVVGLALPTAFGIYRMEQARGLVEDITQESPTAGRVTVAEPETDPYAEQFQTILLLGSDEGDDRVGMRTDSMILAFIHKETGRTALVSVPRNLTGLQFPPGGALAERWPDGYDDDEQGLLNAVYANVENDPDLVEAYGDDVADAGVHALMEGLSYTFNLTIDDYLEVNSCAFVGLVDAIGGVTITLDTALPMPSKMRCSNYRLDPTIGPGPVFMDGTKALGYVRSRTADSDYQRMERQRLMIQTIAEKVDFADVLTSFDELADAVRDNIRMSMTWDEVRLLISVLRDRAGDMVSIGLTPPLFEPGDPDYPALQDLLQDIRRAVAEGIPVDQVLPGDAEGDTEGVESGAGTTDG
ncbi:MAG: LCP family protein [Acidimicrobiaceae bacterium]|nr:LCP family protein [Ilumatobacter sp.]MCB9380747.1 LCP family protein [Acidimicrobiaceae bacterium]